MTCSIYGRQRVFVEMCRNKSDTVAGLCMKLLSAESAGQEIVRKYSERLTAKTKTFGSKCSFCSSRQIIFLLGVANIDN